MKTFKQIISEVAQPKGKDELEFKDKHMFTKKDYPVPGTEHQFTSKTKRSKRPGDYHPDDYKKVYEALDPVGKEDELEEKLVGGQKKLDHNKNGKIDAHDFHLMRKKKMKEEAEQLDELSPNTLHSYIKKAAGNMAGNAAVAAAQASSSMKKSSPDVKRNIRNRMRGITSASGRLADKANMTENAWEEVPMMMRQLQFIAYASEEIMEYLDMQVDPEEWFQNKLAQVHYQMQTLHAYMEGDKRMMSRMGGMYGEEVELDEAKIHSSWKTHFDNSDHIVGASRNAAAALHKKLNGAPATKKDVNDLWKSSKIKMSDRLLFKPNHDAILHHYDRLRKGETADYSKNESVGEVELDEAKMTDEDVLKAAKALAKNGKDAKTREFGKGLVSHHKKEGSFTPAQVGGLQNIMKNASFQMAKESFESDQLDESDITSKMLTVGRRLQAMAPKEKNDMLSNAMARLGDHIENFGAPFGPKTIDELAKKSRLPVNVVKTLIKKTSVNESMELDEISKKTLGSYIKKASDDMANNAYTLGARDPLKPKGSWGKSFKRRAGIAKATDRLTRESIELDENFKTGTVKLNDGSTVLLKKQDADLLNQMFDDLNSSNKKKMMGVAMKDKAGFNEILGFAREAL